MRCEIGDSIGLFQPAHGSAPNIVGQDKANPLAAILSGVLMLDYLAEKLENPHLQTPRFLMTRLRPDLPRSKCVLLSLAGYMGTHATTAAISEILTG